LRQNNDPIQRVRSIAASPVPSISRERGKDAAARNGEPTLAVFIAYNFNPEGGRR
jgi:hypothetical protein